MEVLESITSYVEKIRGKSYFDNNQKEALDILYNYCHYTEPQMNICEIDSGFFDEFLMYWLPKNKSRLKTQEVYEVLKGVGGYCSYIRRVHNIPSLEQYEVMKVYKKDCLRIYKLKSLFLEYLGDPILNTNPLVVDFEAYKQYKVRKDNKQRKGVYQQGLFEVVEVDYDNTVVFRRLPRGTCVRVVLTKMLALYIKKGDILHLRIKQKQFFALWEVEELRNCYLPEAGQYLSN